MPTLTLDDNLKSRLVGATTEMKTDKFWRDMAKPIDKALRLLKDSEDAFDSVSAKEYLKQSITAFADAECELDKAAENKIFVSEAALVKTALAQLRGDEGVEELQAKADAAAANKMDAKDNDALAKQAGVVPKPAPAAPVAAVWDAEGAAKTPYTWEADADEEGAVNVRVAVPPETARGDVTVKFSTQHLTCCVKNHPLQPSVIDAALLYAIKPGECSWGLEGKGAKRVLVLNVEKAEPGANWVGLLDDEEGRTKKGLQSVAAGIEGVDLQDLKPYGAPIS